MHYLELPNLSFMLLLTIRTEEVRYLALAGQASSTVLYLTIHLRESSREALRTPINLHLSIDTGDY